MKLGWMAILTAMVFALSLGLIISCSETSDEDAVVDSESEPLGQVVVNGTPSISGDPTKSAPGIHVSKIPDSQYSDAGIPDTTIAWGDYDHPDWFKLPSHHFRPLGDFAMGCRLEWDTLDSGVELDLRVFYGTDNPPADYPYKAYSDAPEAWNSYYQKADMGKILWIFPEGRDTMSDAIGPPVYVFVGNPSGQTGHEYSLHCWQLLGTIETPDDLIEPDINDAPTTSEQEPNDSHVDAHDLSEYFDGQYGSHPQTDICELQCDFDANDGELACKTTYWDCVIATGDEPTCADENDKCLNDNFSVWVDCFYGCECATEMDACFTASQSTEDFQKCVDQFDVCSGYNLDWRNWCMGECISDKSSCNYRCHPMLMTDEEYTNCLKNCDLNYCGCQGDCLDRSA
jgi:hypothetical protein